MIEAIACIGDRGQLGLEGKIPWTPDAAPGDLEWFKTMTMASDVCVVGHNTAVKMPVLAGRAVVVDLPRADPIVFLRTLGFDPAKHRIMIIGGEKTYARWMSYISRWHIGRADYDGPADSWMPQLW